jgi:hypothetical protein
MQRRLTVEDYNIAIAQVPVNLLVARRWAERGARSGIPLGREKLIGNGRALLEGRPIQRYLRTVLVLHERCTGMHPRAVDDELTQLVYVLRSDRFGVREFLGEDGRDADLIGLDVDVGGDDGSSGVVDTLALRSTSVTSRRDVIR